MARKILSDRQWEMIDPLLPGRPGTVGRPPSVNNRTTLEAILWIARTGAPWRDLPPEFGKWNTVYQRFRRWVVGGVLEKVFTTLSSKLQMNAVMVDGTFIKVHHHGTGAPKEAAHPKNLSSLTP